jgi:hypothetical protein
MRAQTSLWIAGSIVFLVGIAAVKAWPFFATPRCPTQRSFAINCPNDSGVRLLMGAGAVVIALALWS